MKTLPLSLLCFASSWWQICSYQNATTSTGTTARKSVFRIVNGDLYLVEEPEGNLLDATTAILGAQADSKSITLPPNERQSSVWEALSTFDSKKNSVFYQR